VLCQEKALEFCPNPLRSSYPLEFRNSRLPSGEQVHFVNICTQLTSWALGRGPILSSSLSFDIRCRNLQHSSQQPEKAVSLYLTHRDQLIPIPLPALNPGHVINASMKMSDSVLFTQDYWVWTSSIVRYTTERNIPSKGERVGPNRVDVTHPLTWDGNSLRYIPEDRILHTGNGSGFRTAVFSRNPENAKKKKKSKVKLSP
jgi:hypothetical protein